MSTLQLLGAGQQNEAFGPFVASPATRLEGGRSLGNFEIQIVMETFTRAHIPMIGGLASAHRNRRTIELNWRLTHRQELRRYLGEWLVLEGENVVAHGQSIVDVVREARVLGVRVPYVFRVQDSSEDVVPIGL